MTLWAHSHVIKVDAFYLRCAFCRKDITGLEPSQAKVVATAEAAGAVILKLPNKHDFLACKGCKTQSLIEFREDVE